MKFHPLYGVAAMAVSGFSVAGLAPILSTPATAIGPEVQEEHAAASLIGQFRTSTSSFLWLRTDLYLHNGVEMRQMTEDEKKSGMATEDSAEDGHKKLLDESAVLTIVPPKERDFRGVFGDIERATSAYKDMHQHTHNDPTATLPLFRLMTWIDPSFVPGWVNGAAIIGWEKTKAGHLKAIEYLKDGLRENPHSVQILCEIGDLYARRMGNPRKAIGYLEQAREVGHHKEWIRDDAERDALEQCYRWLSLCYRDLDEPQRMSAVAREGVKMFPDDVVLGRLLNPPPLIFTDSYQREWLQSRSPRRNAPKPQEVL